MKPGEKVIIVDDVIATGGSLCAAVTLMKDLQAEVPECLVLIELGHLDGKDTVPIPVKSFIKYQLPSWINAFVNIFLTAIYHT